MNLNKVHAIYFTSSEPEIEHDTRVVENLIRDRNIPSFNLVLNTGYPVYSDFPNSLPTNPPFFTVVLSTVICMHYGKDGQPQA
jgi:hypothetical protein